MSASTRTLSTHAGRYGVSAVLVCVLFAMLGGCDRFLSTEQRMQRAQSEYAAGNYRAASADTKTVLDSESGNAAARILLARIALRLGDPESARAELDRARTAGGDAATVRDLGYTVLLVEGRYEDVVAATTADAATGGVNRLVALANAQTSLGRYEDADSTLRQAVALAGNDPHVLLEQARWLWATGKPADASAKLQDLEKREPSFAGASLLAGRLALSSGDPRAASAAFDRARAHLTTLDFPDQVRVWTGAIESRLELSDVDGADTILKTLAARAPEAFVTRYLRGRIAYARHDLPLATENLQRALASQPDNVAARFLFGAALSEQGLLEQAGVQLASLLKDHPENLQARKLLARVYLQRHDSDAAQRLLAEVPENSPQDADIDWLSGTVRLMSGDTDQAIALLEQGSAAAPGNVALRLDLAQAYLVARRPEQARDVLKALPAGQGGLRRSQLSVLSEVAGKDTTQAVAAVAALAKQYSGDSGLVTLCGAYLLGVGRVDAATELFDKAISVDARNLNARLGRAEAALRRTDLAGAELQLRKVLELDAKNEPAYLGLASLAIAHSDRAAARAQLEKAIGSSPGVVESRLRLAELDFADKDAVRASALLDQALAVTHDRTTTIFRAGQIRMRAGRFEDALRDFNEAARLGYAPATVNAAMALVALGKIEEGRGKLEAAVREHPAEPRSLAALVSLDAHDRRFDAALARIAAFEKAGGQPAAADELRGQVLMVAGRAADAYEAFTRAAKARPSASLAVRSFRAGLAAKKPAPESNLRTWLAQHPDDVPVRVLLAEELSRRNQRADAITEYEQAARVRPNAIVLNNLAWLYHESADARALDVAREALQLAPSNVSVMDTYGWLLLERGRTDEALKQLEAAANRGPGEAEVQYHYAVALARSGKKDQAVTTLRKVLASAGTSSWRGDAEALLKSLT